MGLACIILGHKWPEKPIAREERADGQAGVAFFVCKRCLHPEKVEMPEV